MRETRPIAMKRRKLLLKIVDLNSLRSAARKVMGKKKSRRATLKIQRQLSQKFMIHVNIAKAHMDMIPYSWNALGAFGRITVEFALYAITRFLLNESTRKTLCVDVTIAEQSHTRMREHQKLHSIPLATKKIETINVVIRTLLCTWIVEPFK